MAAILGVGWAFYLEVALESEDWTNIAKRIPYILNLSLPL